MSSLVRVVFQPLGHVLRVAPGTPLDRVARDAGVPLAQACRGAGLCGRCAVEVVAGGSSGLSGCEPAERETIERQGVQPGFRLACCARVLGPIDVTTPYW